MGWNRQQQEAKRRLEQLQIKHWKFIKPFLQDFFYYSTLAGCFYDQTIGDKLFLKLPDPLGTEIRKEYKKLEHHPALHNFAT